MKLLIGYLYEGEYESLLPNEEHVANTTNCATSQLQVVRTETWNDDFGVSYTYEFPHTCTSPHNYCDGEVLCRITSVTLIVDLIVRTSSATNVLAHQSTEQLISS